MQHIDISIIMPIWNGADTLDRAIHSLIDQEYFKAIPLPQVELVMVDDYSNEQTRSKIKDWVRRLKAGITSNLHVTALRHLRNEGTSVARNTGIDASSGDVIGYLDVDDEYDPFRIVDGYLALTKYSNADICLSPYRLDDGSKLGEWHPERIENINGREREFLQVSSITIPIGLMHTRKIFDKCVNKFGHGFPPGIVCGEDGVLVRRMADLGAKFTYTQSLAGTYHISQFGQSRTQRRPDSGLGYAYDNQDPNGSNGQYLDKIALEAKNG